MPLAVSGLSNTVAMTAGAQHSCALSADGTEKCWGFNRYGQLGDLTTTDSSTPVAVSGVTSASVIATGSYHSCALLANGTTKCWGDNVLGQLGLGTTSGPHVCSGSGCNPTPTLVPGVANAAALAEGYYHSCALSANGTAKCWGNGTSGQLGNNSTSSASTPVTVLGL